MVMNVWAYEWIHECMNECMNAWMYEWINESTNHWEWYNKKLHIPKKKKIKYNWIVQRKDRNRNKNVTHEPETSWGRTLQCSLVLWPLHNKKTYNSASEYVFVHSMGSFMFILQAKSTATTYEIIQAQTNWKSKIDTYIHMYFFKNYFCRVAMN